MTPRYRVFGIPCRVTCALAFLVIEIVTAKREKVVPRKFFLQEIHDGIFRSRATLFSRPAVRGIRSSFRLNFAAHGWHIALVHVPGFGRHMDGLRKLVI